MPVVVMALVVAAVVPPVKSSSATNGAAAGPPAEMSTPPEPELEPTVQVNDVDPFAPVESVAVTVTVDVPVAVGVPEIRPVEELIERPAGRPVAVYFRVWPDAESVAPICRLAAVPAVEVWL